jgi:hypothetical protein
MLMPDAASQEFAATGQNFGYGDEKDEKRSQSVPAQGGAPRLEARSRYPNTTGPNRTELNHSLPFTLRSAQRRTNGYAERGTEDREWRGMNETKN